MKDRILIIKILDLIVLGTIFVLIAHCYPILAIYGLIKSGFDVVKLLITLVKWLILMFISGTINISYWIWCIKSGDEKE